MTITIKPVIAEIDGVEYELRLAIVEKTFLGYEDHGIWAFAIGFMGEGNSWGQSLGHIGLGEGGNGTEYFLKEMLRVFQVRQWEHIKSKRIYVGRKDGLIKALVSLDHKQYFTMDGAVKALQSGVDGLL